MSRLDCLSEVTTTDISEKPPKSDQTFKNTTTTSSKAPMEAIRSHSPTPGPELLVQTSSSRPPPTAMVAPLVGSTSSSGRLRPTSSSACASLSNSPSRSPKMSRHGLEMKGFGMQPALSSPSLDRACLRDGGSSSSKVDVTSEKIRSLMNILGEKSQLIERQKQTISRLQQECRDKDSKLRKQNHIVQHHPTEISSSVSAESATSISAPVKIDMLSRKLDSLHYELDKNTEELKTANEKLKDRESYCAELEKQLDESHSQSKELEQRIEQLQGYLGNMPTMDEHYGLKEEVVSLQTQCQRLREQVREGEETLVSIRESLKKKEEELCQRLSESVEASQKNHDLELRVHSQERRILELHSEKSQMKSEILKLQEVLDQSDITLRKELNSMRERHKLRFRDATAKLREQHKEVVKRNKLLEKQLLKSSDAMTALNSELKAGQGQISDLKGSISELVVQNQGLLQQNLTLQEAHAEAVRSTQSSPADTGLSQRLVQEISLCVDDFESLISLVSSMVEGREPNASVLLGIKSTTESITSLPVSCSGSDDMETCLQKHIDQIVKLRREVERLRTLVTERFTDQIANECTVQ